MSGIVAVFVYGTMAAAWLVREVTTLADQLDSNVISPEEARDRAEHLNENIAEYSALSANEVDAVVFSNLREVIDRLSNTPRSLGRPAVHIPIDVIETYLLTGLKITEIAELYGVCQRTIQRRMEQHGFR